jgi:MATE family multidrug resistance protein
MAKMVDMSRRELGESDALQGVQVFLVEFGLIAMGVVDTLMVGHVGEAALAAACLGGTTTWLVMITAIGLLGALDPLTSQAFGAEDDAAVKRHLRSGLYASVALNAGCMLILTMAVAPLYAVCGQPSLLAAAASHYCHIEAWGILPVLLFQAIRLSLMSTNVFRPLVVAITIANATNVALNQVLINGMTVAGYHDPGVRAHRRGVGDGDQPMDTPRVDVRIRV